MTDQKPIPSPRQPMLTVTTASYDALGTLLPEQTLQVLSTFACDWRDDTTQEPIVLGLWVQLSGTIVEPRYLSAPQLADIQRTS